MTRSGEGASVPSLVAVPSPTDAVEEAVVTDSSEYARRIYDLTERVLELDLRLRERVECERVLDAEVRSLQRDAELRQAYIADVEAKHSALATEHAALEAHARALQARTEELVREVEAAQARAAVEEGHRRAIQARAVVRLADSLAQRAASHPVPVRVGSWALRRVARKLP